MTHSYPVEHRAPTHASRYAHAVMALGYRVADCVGGWLTVESDGPPDSAAIERAIGAVDHAIGMEAAREWVSAHGGHRHFHQKS